MRRAATYVLILALVLSSIPASGLAQARPKAKPAASATQPLDGFDAFVEEQMKVWKVPGLAVAVVKEGKVVHLKGYGQRDVERNLPVTPQTLFAIGSITKSFTVAGLATLADEGKLDWDKSVREYLPEFRLFDPMASERMTPRDLVTHRSGLPRHDALWYNSTFTRKEMVERLRYLEPSRDLRTTFQYNNLMFLTAGYLAEKLSGMGWEEFTRQRILAPLGMARSNFSVLDSERSNDFARPYEKAKQEVKGVPFRVIDNMAPAGSINSSVEEMSRYLMMLMNKGKYEGKQVISENYATQMQTPQMPTPAPSPWKELGHTSYGMGLFVTSYRGHRHVHHGGAIDGFIAFLSFLPDDNVGVVVLTNLSPSPLPTVVAYNVYDRFLGLEPVAWSQRLKEQQDKMEAAEEEAKKKGYTPRVEGTQPSHKLTDYTGEYEHPGYGVLWIEAEGSDLKLTFNRIVSPLKHFHYDIFEVPENPLDPFERAKVQFLMNARGEIDRVLVPMEPNVKEIVFARKAAAEMRQRAFLEPLTGEYVLGAQTVTVTLQGDDTLKLTVPGQRPYELVPRSGMTFDLKGLTGFSVEFKKDTGELVFYQPNGTFVAKRK
ncbi:MAG TPA: serine hydrolase [Candidatus Xenobia bacterium]|nr:serine hydrolase [Candidatus Xenobia bacterium]